MVKIHYLIIFLLLGCCVECSKPVPFSWYQLEPGLFLGEFDAPTPARWGDSKITVLRINPKYFEANIYTASQFDQQRRTAKQWCDKLDLVAAINAGMYATDNLTAVGFLKTGDHVNNPSFHKKHNSVFACQPKDKSVPPFQIIDIQYQNFKELKKKYSSFVQSIRMISTKQKNVWEKQPNAWSIAALGVN